MFKNIEKIIRGCYKIIIEEERYGNGLLIGMECKIPPYHELIEDLIDRATSPGDVGAIEALDILMEFSTKYPEFPFVYAETLEQGLLELDKRLALWNKLDSCKIQKILDELRELTKDHSDILMD